MFETSAPGPMAKGLVSYKTTHPLSGIEAPLPQQRPSDPRSHPWPSKRIGTCGWYAAVQQVVYPGAFVPSG